MAHPHPVVKAFSLITTNSFDLHDLLITLCKNTYRIFTACPLMSRHRKAPPLQPDACNRTSKAHTLCIFGNYEPERIARTVSACLAYPRENSWLISKPVSTVKSCFASRIIPHEVCSKADPKSSFIESERLNEKRFLEGRSRRCSVLLRARPADRIGSAGGE